VVIFRIAAGHAREAQVLELFGYFQSKFASSTGNSFGSSQNSFSVHQLNIFLRKEFGHDFYAFLNIELTSALRSPKMV